MQDTNEPDTNASPNLMLFMEQWQPLADKLAVLGLTVDMPALLAELKAQPGETLSTEERMAIDDTCEVIRSLMPVTELILSLARETDV